MPLAFGFRILHLPRVGIRLRRRIMRSLVDATRLDEVTRRVVVLLLRCVVALAVHVRLRLLAGIVASALRPARLRALLRLLLVTH